MTERRPEDAPPVLTVGHSTRNFERFTELLPANGTGTLADVIRRPVEHVLDETRRWAREFTSFAMVLEGGGRRTAYAA